MRQPGELAKLAGVEVEEYYALDEPVPVFGPEWNGNSYFWAERLKLVDETGTQILAKYGTSNGWLDDQPAITQHSYGKGMVTFIGAYLDDASQKALLQQITQQADVQSALRTPAGVEACKRVNAANQEIFILINHTRTEQRLQLPWQAQEHLQGQAIGNELTLAPYGVAVVTAFN